MERPEDIRLFRLGAEQETIPLRSDEGYVYYEGIVYALDELEIGLREGVEIKMPEETVVKEEAISEKEAEESVEEDIVSKEKGEDHDALILVSVAVFVVAGYFILKKRELV